jgi:hypothetical protein
MMLIAPRHAGRFIPSGILLMLESDVQHTYI